MKKAGFESVTIYEQSKVIQEVGAGIQIAPNLARLLARWGVLEELREDAIALVCNSLRRYEDDSELGSSPFMCVQTRLPPLFRAWLSRLTRAVPDSRPNVEEAYGAPLWVVHRADLQLRLLEFAKRIGVTVNTSAHVSEVDFNAIYYEESFMTETIGPPRILIKNRGEAEGRWVEADVVIAADGIRSLARGAMMARHGTVDEGARTARRLVGSAC